MNKSAFTWENVGRLVKDKLGHAGLEATGAACDFVHEAVSTRELAMLGAVLRNIPMNLMLLRPDSNTIWLVSRELAKNLKVQVGELEGQDLSDVVEMSGESLDALHCKLKTESVSDVAVKILQQAGDPVNLLVRVLGVPTVFGRIGVAFGGL